MKTILAALIVVVSPVSAGVLYLEGFDDAADAKVKIAAGANTIIEPSMDYSNFSIGATNHSIPEAPGRIPGSAPTRGMLMRQGYNGTARIINAVLADSFGGNPITFTGSYRLKFDIFLNMAPNGVTGTTENAIWGIGNDDIGRAAYVNRSTTAIGTWGWLTGDGRIGSSGDAGFYQNSTRLAIRENIVDADLYQSTFSAGSLPVAYTPSRNWTRVEVICFADPLPSTSATVSTYFNGVKFFEGVSSAAAGYALFGYEDPFTGSNSDSPESQFCIVDNVVVESLNGYDLYISAYFPLGSANAQPLMDPENDGLSNLLEYGFGMNPSAHEPLTPVNPSSPATNLVGMAPVIDYVNSPPGLRVSFVRRIDDPSATFFFDVATSPGAWITLNLNGATTTPIDVGWEFVQYTVPAASLGPSTGKLFGRLRLTEN